MCFVKRFSLILILILLSSVFAAAKCKTCIYGKVRDKKGKALAGVSISAIQDGKTVRSTETNPKGKFELRLIKEGRYNIVFDKTGFSSKVLRDVYIEKGSRINLRSRVRMLVDQGTLTIVEASVFNQNGFSLYGAKVVIEEVFSDGTSKKVGSGYASRDGDIVFRFAEKPTKYRITASVKGISATKEIDVNEAAIYRAAITLDLSKDKK